MTVIAAAQFVVLMLLTWRLIGVMQSLKRVQERLDRIEASRSC